MDSLQVPEAIVSRIVSTLRKDQQQSINKTNAERSMLETRLATIHKQIDNAYADKLDGIITADLWERKSNDWRIEEQQVKMAIEGLKSVETSDRALDTERIFELANKAYSLYVSQGSTEKAKLLKKLFSNCLADAVRVTPTYRKSFDMIFKRVKSEEWSALGDDFRTFQGSDVSFGSSLLAI